MTRFRLAQSVLVIALATSAHAQAKRATLDPAAGWEATKSQADDPARLQLDEARSLIAREEASKAKSILDDWLDDDDFAQSQYRAEALRLRGDAKYAMGNEYKALYDYEQVIREYPASSEYVVAIQREVEIGKKYLSGLRKRWLGMRIEAKAGTGEELLIRAQERMPGSLVAEDAAIFLADYYFDKRRLEMASDMYDIFLRNYPSSPHRMHAMQRRVYANIAQFKGPRYDGSLLLESKLLIQRFARDYPAQAEQAGLTSALVVRLEESAAAQQLESAKWYIRVGDGPAARFTLNRLVRDHTGTVAATEGLSILQDRGWLETQRQSVEPEILGPTANVEVEP